MFIDNVVSVTSNNLQKSRYGIVPNFLFINKPEAKVKGNKKVKTKKLIVWFDLESYKNEGGLLNDYQGKNELILKDFVWQLVDESNGVNEPLKPINVKDNKAIETIKIKKDGKDNLVDQTNSIVYELDADKLNDTLKLRYALGYNNNQKVGITSNGVSGTNSGYINIDTKTKPNVINNAYYYANNKENGIIDNYQLKVESSNINNLFEIRKPLAAIILNKKENNCNEIAKSELLSSELERLHKDRINYVEISNKGLKTVKNGNRYEIYQEVGNTYDFQTNKWKEDQESSLGYIKDKELVINYEFNNLKQEIKVPVKELSSELIKGYLDVDPYITYQDIKANTKYETFLKNRELNLWK